MSDLSRSLKRRRSSGSIKDTSLKSSKPSTQKALIVDNGAYTIKVGYSKDEGPRVVPNCIMKAKSERKRYFTGQQIDECRDCSGLYFLLPCERGYITRWDVQKPVWDHVFSKAGYPIGDNPVILTQPPKNFRSIQECTDEIFFEEYDVPSLLRCCPTDLAYMRYAKDHKWDRSEPCLIVDSGYSFTHIIPYIKGNKFAHGIRRLSVGGKILTNHLKDIISYRQYNVMEESYVINQVKEDTCYVSSDIKQEVLEAGKPYGINSIVRNYVLPDFNQIRRGYIQDPNKTQQNETDDAYQILRLNNERFIVPEILFHPSDVTLRGMGIPEAIVRSIYLCPKEFRKSLAKNIILIGGNCKFPGFKERLYSEVRSSIPTDWQLNMYLPEDPVTYAWKGGSALLKSVVFDNMLVTRQQYEELGSSQVHDKFYKFMYDVNKPEEEEESKNEETFKYLPRIKSSSIFGKVDPIPLPADDTNSESSQNVEKEDTEESSQETTDGEKVIRKTFGRPSKVKPGIDQTAQIEKDSSVDDIFDDPKLFPFGRDLL